MLELHRLSVHVVEPTLLLCTECDMEFSNEAQLRTHKARKHPKVLKQYICGVEGCSETFGSVILLRTHQQTIHGVEKPLFRCDAPGCSYTSSLRNSLLYHKRYVHDMQSNVRYECSTCSAIFKQKVDLDRHVLRNCDSIRRNYGFRKKGLVMQFFLSSYDFTLHRL
jgi:uncharacterized Zn-finger protein